MPLVRTSASTHPHVVAQAAVRVAQRHAADPRHRLPTLAVLAPYLPPAAEADPDGRWMPACLARWAQTVVHVREPADIGEVVAPPLVTARLGAGDCDDVAAAVAGFAALFGLPAAVATYPIAPGHAHIVALVGPRWYGAPTDNPWTAAIDATGLSAWSNSAARSLAARTFVVRAP